MRWPAVDAVAPKRAPGANWAAARLGGGERAGLMHHAQALGKALDHAAHHRRIVVDEDVRAVCDRLALIEGIDQDEELAYW